MDMDIKNVIEMKLNEYGYEIWTWTDLIFNFYRNLKPNIEPEEKESITKLEIAKDGGRQATNTNDGMRIELDVDIEGCIDVDVDDEIDDADVDALDMNVDAEDDVDDDVDGDGRMPMPFQTIRMCFRAQIASLCSAIGRTPHGVPSNKNIKIIIKNK